MENEKFEIMHELLRKFRNKLSKKHLNGNGGPVVLLDAGHGNFIEDEYQTAGKRYTHADDYVFYEGTFNRVVMNCFAYELLCANRNYQMILPSDKDYYLSERTKYIKRIGADLKAEGYKPYVVSIHGNAFHDQRANGLEVWTSPGQTTSDSLATIYYQKLMNLGWKMRNNMSDGDPDKEAKFNILVKHPLPALLLELGFYSNYEQSLEMIKPEIISTIGLLMLGADMEIERLGLLK